MVANFELGKYKKKIILRDDVSGDILRSQVGSCRGIHGGSKEGHLCAQLSCGPTPGISWWAGLLSVGRIALGKKTQMQMEESELRWELLVQLVRLVKVVHLVKVKDS